MPKRHREKEQARSRQQFIRQGYPNRVKVRYQDVTRDGVTIGHIVVGSSMPWLAIREGGGSKQFETEAAAVAWIERGLDRG